MNGFWRTAVDVGHRLKAFSIPHCVLKCHGGDPNYYDGNVDVVIGESLWDAYRRALAGDFVVRPRDRVKNRLYERNKLMLSPREQGLVQVHLHSCAGWHDLCFMPAARILNNAREVSIGDASVKVARRDDDARILLLHIAFEQFRISRSDRQFLRAEDYTSLAEDCGMPKVRIARISDAEGTIPLRVLMPIWRCYYRFLGRTVPVALWNRILHWGLFLVAQLRGIRDSLQCSRELTGSGVRPRVHKGMAVWVMQRRNSVISLHADARAGSYVTKRYFRRYSAEQECRAYREADEVLEMIGGIRRAEVYELDRSQNAVRLEYINGPSLLEDFLSRGVQAFDERRKRLVSLFATAREHGARFDSDPTNFISDRKTGELVLVDPVCDGVNVPDFTMVVFLWGMLKSFLRRWRHPQVVGFARCWMEYYVTYLDATQGRCRDLNRQMVRYIDEVIRWNTAESQGESLWKQAARRVVVVPVWSLIKHAFKWNMVRRRDDGAMSARCTK